MFNLNSMWTDKESRISNNIQGEQNAKRKKKQKWRRRVLNLYQNDYFSLEMKIRHSFPFYMMMYDLKQIKKISQLHFHFHLHLCRYSFCHLNNIISTNIFIISSCQTNRAWKKNIILIFSYSCQSNIKFFFCLYELVIFTK